MPRQAPIPAPDGAFDADAVWTLFEGRTDRMRQVWRITRSTLPGSASNFGAHALVATARRIEDHAGEGHVPAGDVRVARTQFDALCTAMTAWLDQVSAPPDAPSAG
jgi:hypothetical protein